jgi:DNA-binding transcriptional LysR family regulator
MEVSCLPAGHVPSKAVFELSHLRCFVAVAEELHFGRAATRLNMTQPPLSRQIQVLERLLGVEVFKRNNRSVELTSAGKAFLADARRIVRLSEAASLTVKRATSGEVGSITLGFTAASGYSFVPKFLASTRENLPNVDINLKEMVSVEQTDALLTGQIDLGLMRPPIRRPEFRSQLVMRERLLAASCVRDLVGARETAAIEDFDGASIIMYSPDGARYFHDLLASLFLNAGATPRYVHFLSQIHSILALVGAGLGHAIVPAAARALHFDNVIFREIDGVADPVELYLVWRADSDNPALDRILSMLPAS